jgi:enoyl-CoA hydratase/3-hydroxyacyl-CoA dehydrogenase
VKGFVLTGYGQAAFSAGADIGKFPADARRPGGRGPVRPRLRQGPAFHRRHAKARRGGGQRFCHGRRPGTGHPLPCRIVATAGSTFQFPEITLGILPGIGGCAVPYRRWPQGAAVFNEMICLGKPLKTAQAAEIGMVSKVAADTPELIDLAVAAVGDLAGNLPAIPAGPMEAPAI